MSDWSSQMELYLSLERNEQFRAQAEQLEPEELKRVFDSPRLTFGTAGIRGTMGPGFGQMNDLVVIQSSQGLISYLLEEYGDGLCKKRGVIIGHDARHNSARFARLTALAFLQKSIPVYFCDQIIPTPLIAYGVRYFDCYCGVVITASHNPKQDNGYKVYWANGAQIQSPHDKNIQVHIMKEENLRPWSRELSWSHEYLMQPASNTTATSATKTTGSSNISTKARLPEEMSGNFFRVYDELCKSYFAYIQRLVDELRSLNRLAPIRITYTTLHGVGHYFITRALQIAGFRHCHPVEAQSEPNPDFPTVKFPNPEEAGALDLAFETAARTSSNLILANDPDADRCAAALYCPTSQSRRLLTGNEIGALLGWWAWHQHQNSLQKLSGGTTSNTGHKGATMIQSSSSSIGGQQEPEPVRSYDDDDDYAEISADKTPATPINKPSIAIGCVQLSQSSGLLRARPVAKKSLKRKTVPILKRPEDCYMITTAVSSRFLHSMARKEQFNFIETLTGFKYMGNVAHDLLNRGKQVLFAYEEAIGFMVDTQILDKDGISAAVQLAQCAAYLATNYQRTLESQLDWLYVRYGYHFSLNSYYLCRDPRTIRAIFHELQSNYPKYFKSTNQKDEEFCVTRIRDLNNGIDNGTPDHKPDLPVSANSFMVTFFIGEEIRFTIRTSGTEPKIKFYSEIVAPLPVENESDQRAAKLVAQARLQRFVDAAIKRCLKPEFYKLERADM